MWKYFTKEQSYEFLLSLELIDNKLTDKEKLKTIYTVSNNIEKNYKVFKIKKQNNKLRTINEPSYILKHMQNNILNNILNNKQISKYAKAYYKGSHLIDNASPHINKSIILKIDIKNFFENISFLNVYKHCFPLEYFPKSIGILLTNLCTYQGYLPQGAVTSAYISNLIMKNFDEEVGFFCEENNISYTRYSDDMTFSGDFNQYEVIKLIRKKLDKLGLEINNEKIHVIKKWQKQVVTGIIVNEKPQVDINYRKKIRQEMFYIKKYGFDMHLKKIQYKGTKDAYISSLYGKIIYVLQINKDDKEFIVYKNYLIAK